MLSSLQTLSAHLQKTPIKTIVVITDAERDDQAAYHQMYLIKKFMKECFGKDVEITLIFDEGNEDYPVPTEKRRESMQAYCKQHDFTFLEGAPSRKTLMQAESPYNPSDDVRTAINQAERSAAGSNPGESA